MWRRDCPQHDGEVLATMPSRYQTQASATMITHQDLKRWNRALTRLRTDLEQQVKIYTPEEIQRLYPNGYPISRLQQAGQSADERQLTRRGRPKKAALLAGYILLLTLNGDRFDLGPFMKYETCDRLREQVLRLPGVTEAACWDERSER